MKNIHITNNSKILNYNENINYMWKITNESKKQMVLMSL